ncbi:hypothetical protein BDZ85DRAFT_283297 [Elsinoe ampelina]|uniref:Uncharacterized protein n=1 Tax=Elsinoe ampelina TaxID=302913 RepID=A0A6A6G9D8_9PEZI|nr:hypothetical protein BDZ85DRAFT_283297 [Elsinoe ampelina]
MKLLFQVPPIFQPPVKPAFGTFAKGEIRNFVVPAKDHETFEQIAIRARERYAQNYMEGRIGGWQVKKLTTTDGYDIDLNDAVQDVFDKHDPNDERIVRMHLVLDSDELSMPGDSGLRLGGFKRKRTEQPPQSGKRRKQDNEEVESSPPPAPPRQSTTIPQIETRQDSQGFKVPTKLRSSPAAGPAIPAQQNLSGQPESPGREELAPAQGLPDTLNPTTPNRPMTSVQPEAITASREHASRFESKPLTERHRMFKLPPLPGQPPAQVNNVQRDTHNDVLASSTGRTPQATSAGSITRALTAVPRRLTQANLDTMGPPADIVSPFISSLLRPETAAPATLDDPDELTEPGTQPQQAARPRSVDLPEQSVDLPEQSVDLPEQSVDLPEDPWLPEEDQVILAAIHDDVRVKDIQQTLPKRSKTAIRQRRKELRDEAQEHTTSTAQQIRSVSEAQHDEDTAPNPPNRPTVNGSATRSNTLEDGAWNRIDINNMRIGLQHHQSFQEIRNRHFPHRLQREVFAKLQEVEQVVRNEEEAARKTAYRRQRILLEDQSGRRSTLPSEPFTQSEEDLLLAARLANAEIARVADKYFPRRPSNQVVKRASTLYHRVRGKAQNKNPAVSVTDEHVMESMDAAGWVRVQAWFSQIEVDKAEFNELRSAEIDVREQNIIEEEERKRRRQVDRARQEQLQRLMSSQEAKDRQAKRDTELRVQEDDTLKAEYARQIKLWKQHCEQARHRGQPEPPRPPTPRPSTIGLYRELALSSPAAQRQAENTEQDPAQERMEREPTPARTRRSSDHEALRSDNGRRWDPDTQKTMGLDGMDGLSAIPRTSSDGVEPTTPKRTSTVPQRTDAVRAGPSSKARIKLDGKLTSLLPKPGRMSSAAARRQSADHNTTAVIQDSYEAPPSSKKRGKQPAAVPNAPVQREAIVEIEPADPLRLSQFVKMDDSNVAGKSGEAAAGAESDGNSSTAVLPASSNQQNANAKRRQTTLSFPLLKNEKASVVQPKRIAGANLPIAGSSKSKAKKTIGVTIHGSPYHSSIPDQAFADVADRVERESLHQASSQPNIDTSPARPEVFRQSRHTSLDSSAEQLQREMKMASSAKPVSSEAHADTEMHDFQHDTGDVEYEIERQFHHTQPSSGVLAAAATLPQHGPSEDVDIIYGDVRSDEDSVPPSPQVNAQEGDKPQWWYEEQAAREAHDAKAKKRWLAMLRPNVSLDRPIEEISNDDQPGPKDQTQLANAQLPLLQLEKLNSSPPKQPHRGHPPPSKSPSQRHLPSQVPRSSIQPSPKGAKNPADPARTQRPPTQEISSDESESESSDEPPSSSDEDDEDSEPDQDADAAQPGTHATSAPQGGSSSKSPSERSSDRSGPGDRPTSTSTVDAQAQPTQDAPTSDTAQRNTNDISTLGSLRPPFPSSGKVAALSFVGSMEPDALEFFDKLRTLEPRPTVAAELINMRVALLSQQGAAMSRKMLEDVQALEDLLRKGGSVPADRIRDLADNIERTVDKLHKQSSQPSPSSSQQPATKNQTDRLSSQPPPATSANDGKEPRGTSKLPVPTASHIAEPSPSSASISSQLLPPLSQPTPSLPQLDGASDTPVPHSSPVHRHGERRRTDAAKVESRLRRKLRLANDLERARIEAMLASRKADEMAAERKREVAKREKEAHDQRKAKRLCGAKVSPHTSDSELSKEESEGEGGGTSSDGEWKVSQERERERRRSEALEKCRGRQVSRTREDEEDEEDVEGEIQREVQTMQSIEPGRLVPTVVVEEVERVLQVSKEEKVERQYRVDTARTVNGRRVSSESKVASSSQCRKQSMSLSKRELARGLQIDRSF